MKRTYNLTRTSSHNHVIPCTSKVKFVRTTIHEQNKIKMILNGLFLKYKVSLVVKIPFMNHMNRNSDIVAKSQKKICLLNIIMKMKNHIINKLDICKTLSHLIYDTLNIAYTSWFDELNRHKNRNSSKIVSKMDIWNTEILPKISVN